MVVKVAFQFSTQHIQPLGSFPKRLNLFSHLLAVDWNESDAGQYDVLEVRSRGLKRVSANSKRLVVEGKAKWNQREKPQQ